MRKEFPSRQMDRVGGTHHDVGWAEVEIACAVEKGRASTEGNGGAFGLQSREKSLDDSGARSRKGYWRMSGNSVVQRALSNRWLQEQGVRDMKQQWIAIHYPDQGKV